MPSHDTKNFVVRNLQKFLGWIPAFARITSLSSPLTTDSTSLQIYGIDFTSAPRRKKPLTCVSGVLKDDTLILNKLEEFTDKNYADFEAFLQRHGPWIAAIDFPFSLPRRAIEWLEWPTDWSALAQHIGSLTFDEFEADIIRFREANPAGSKHPLRKTDAPARSCSPLMLYGVPVGRMFYQGAFRLQQAGVNIPPCRLVEDSRTVLEGYPALIARRFSKGSYKQEKLDPLKADALKQSRALILEGIQSPDFQSEIGLSIRLDPALAVKMLDDASGDTLDAGLCALAAAWGSQQPNYSIPTDVDSLEGWIVSP